MEERISKSRISFQGQLIGGRSPSASDVGVVVVTFNSARTIARCLELLLTSSVVARLVVPDGACTIVTVAPASGAPSVEVMRPARLAAVVCAWTAGAVASRTASALARRVTRNCFFIGWLPYSRQ